MFHHVLSKTDFLMDPGIIYIIVRKICSIWMSHREYQPKTKSLTEGIPEI